MGSRIIPIIIGMALSVFPAIVYNNGAEEGIYSEKVFEWVAEQMQAPADVPLPPIQFVTQSELRELFETRSRQSFQNWQAAYGSGHARQIMDDYLKDVVGMFNPATGAVYVGRFISPCRQRAVLAHELVHYFQETNQNDDDRAMAIFDPEAMNMIQEMLAYKIEYRFMERVCPDQMDQ